MAEEVRGLGFSEIVGRLDALSQVLARDGVRLACLFGSLLEQPQARDVDLAVWFSEYSFERYLETLEAACRALKTRRVDLVVLNRANALLKLCALLEGKLVFAETPMALAEARVASWKVGWLAIRHE
jgi:predicted nucleotidyltransferase